MNAGSLLKAAGKALLKGTSIVSGLPLGKIAGVGAALGIPKIGSLVGSAQSIDRLLDLVVKIEAIGQAANLTGEQKLLAALPFAKQIVIESGGLDRFKCQDEEQFMAGVKGLLNAVVQIHNSFTDEPADWFKTVAAQGEDLKG